jgi:hypothetical protein
MTTLIDQLTKQSAERFENTFTYKPQGVWDGETVKPQTYLPLTKVNILSFLFQEQKWIAEEVLKEIEKVSEFKIGILIDCKSWDKLKSQLSVKKE